jgi:hypothetical protein
MRREQPAGIVLAFTAITRRQGVTYVVESLACQLIQHTREQILLCSSASLAGVARATFSEQHAIQRLRDKSRNLAFPIPRWEDLQIVQERFGFALVECPAMYESSAILALSNMVNGVALVVASGQMRRTEIEAAQRILQASNANVVGLILNKRKDPVPRLFSQWL